MRRKWGKDEIELLRNLYETDGLGCVEIASILCRSGESVHIACKKSGFHHTKEQERALRSRIHSGKNNGMWGKRGPNLGLTKETSDRIGVAAERQSQTKKALYESGELQRPAGDRNGMWGRVSWRRGQTKENNDKVRCAALKCSETKKKSWKKLPEHEKERRRRAWASQSRKCRKKRTSIELVVDSWLKEMGVEFQPQVQMGRWIPDFYIPFLSVVVECDGDYWHCNPVRYDAAFANLVQKKNMDRDCRKDAFLDAKGIRVIRLWERDIVSGTARNFLASSLRN